MLWGVTGVIVLELMAESAPHFLLVLGCSSRKRHDACLLAALARYDGVNYRVLQRALRARREHGVGDALAARLDILIVSAEFGLLAPDTPIPGYYRCMTL